MKGIKLTLKYLKNLIMAENITTEQLLKLALKEAQETIELQRQMILSLDNQLIEAKQSKDETLKYLQETVHSQSCEIERLTFKIEDLNNHNQQ